jgi:glycosyltransferase involved in cell wall biosynthesis
MARRDNKTRPDHMNAVPASIAAIVLTYDEEVNIERCLGSIAGWCNEIHVVDSGSTDATLAIARRYTPHIHTHGYVDATSQWTWALTSLSIQSDWILLLDADHQVSSELRAQLDRAVATDLGDVDGFYSRHEYRFWGRRMRGFKSYSLRVVRRGSVRVDASELVDMRFVVNGPTKRLSGRVVEDNAKERSIDFWVDKHQKFAYRMAVEEVMRARQMLTRMTQPTLFGNLDQRVTWFKDVWYALPLFVRPGLYFLYRYVFRFGFLDGKTGAIFHFLHAFWFRFLVDLHISRLVGDLREGTLSEHELAGLVRSAK